MAAARAPRAKKNRQSLTVKLFRKFTCNCSQKNCHASYFAKRIAGSYRSAVKAFAKPHHPLIGRAVRERFRADVAGGHFLQPIVAHRRRRSQGGLDIRLRPASRVVAWSAPRSPRNSPPAVPAARKADSAAADRCLAVAKLSVRFPGFFARDGPAHAPAHRPAQILREHRIVVSIHRKTPDRYKPSRPAGNKTARWRSARRRIQTGCNRGTALTWRGDRGGSLVGEGFPSRFFACRPARRKQIAPCGFSAASRAEFGCRGWLTAAGPGPAEPPPSSAKKFCLKTKLRISRTMAPPMPMCIPPNCIPPPPPPPPDSSRRSSMSWLSSPGVHLMAILLRPAMQSAIVTFHRRVRKRVTDCWQVEASPSRRHFTEQSTCDLRCRCRELYESGDDTNARGADWY